MEENNIDKKSCKEAPEKSPNQQFIRDVVVLQKYVTYQSKQDFFYDTRSSDIDKITKAMTDFITELPKLKKDSSAMGRYKYQGLPSMLDDINPVMSKFGLKCIQSPHTIELRTYIVTMIAHVSNQYFRCVSMMPEEFSFAGKITSIEENLQAMGAAQTYIKRYALKAMLGIDADEDTDGVK